MAWHTNLDGTRGCDQCNASWKPTGTPCDCPTPDPGDEIDQPLSKPPKGCLSTVAVERELVRDARAIAALIKVMTPSEAALEAARKRSSSGARKKKTGSIEVIDARFTVELDDGGGDYHLVNAIAKLYDTRLKCLRSAAAAAARREDEEIVKRREKRLRAMRRGAIH